MSSVSPTRFGRLWASSEEMRRVFQELREVAASDNSLIVEGETGTGKELVGEAVHEHSPRRDGPYVVVDCAAIPADLIESELFGHLRGSFTGASSDRVGAFEAADGGTVFIDEIGELPLPLQPKLLRVLERQEVKRVGSNETRGISVRVIAATNRDLAREVTDGRFREDLFFRLNVARVQIPPLRERRDDILLLAERFLAETPAGDGATLELRADARERLARYDWPGNVRELRNIIARGAALSDRYFRIPDDFGRPDDLEAETSGHDRHEKPVGGEGAARPPSRPRPPESGGGAEVGWQTRPLWSGRPYKDARAAVLSDFERGYTEALLLEHKGNISSAARAAGIHRNVFHRMMLRYGIGR